MEYRVLGPLEVVTNGNPLPLGGPRQKAVLADLLIHANQVVTTDRLVYDIWGDEPPRGARNTLQSYVSNLRRVLGEGKIEGRAPGYVLRIRADEVDATRFQALVRDAQTSLTTDPQRAADLLSEGLALWRGPPLADLADEPALRSEVARLEELQRSAIEDRVEAELQLGHHERLIPEVQVLIEANPLRERLWAQLMLALYRASRQAGALSVYERLRKTLAEELGIDPSPDVQRLHEQILRQDPSIATVTRRLRGYSLLEEIGAGSYGVVYRAHQPQVDREVAVKVVHPRLANDSGFIRRFEAEAQMIARLEHPHIVPLYDYWREPNGAYLVMRLLRGGNLRTRVNERALDRGPIAQLMDQVAAALAASHLQGIVHRDVKPANILLDEEGNAYLSDFGIAFEQTSASVPADALWTSGYTSPEQIRGEPPSPKADIYSLGIVLFEALTGRHPFEAASPEELARKHLTEPVPTLASFNAPSDLDEVIRVATAKDPDDRFEDATAFAAAVRNRLAPVRATEAEPRAEPPNPYKGLRPFFESDAADFFGREGLVAQLLARLSDPKLRFLALVGPSGSGKSSVVRAGLIPALRGGAVPGSQNWFVVEMFPGAHPFHELADALTKVAVEPPKNLIDELEADDRGLIDAARRTVPDGSGLVLVVDQLEEAFTLVEEQDERDRFLRSLVAAVAEPGGPIRIVATLRGDFYDRPLRYRRLGELIRAGTEVVLPLSADELERAVAKPAEKVGARWEAALVTEIVADVADQPGALPLLQYTLTELFERRRDGTLTLDSYRAIGGVSGSLVKRAEEIYAGLDEEGKEALRQVFLRLVTLGEGVQDTRRRVPKSELLSLEGRTEPAGRVIDAFGRFRLLSFDRDPQTREPTVEVAHEALLGAWGRLQGWIDSARDDVRMHRRLAAATGEWETAGRDRSFLVRGGRLEQFEKWAGTSELALARTEKEYLDSSVAAREEELTAERERLEREENLRRRSMRRLRALLGVLTVASLVAGVLTFFAVDQRGRARDQATRAEREAQVATARELASASVANLDVDPERSILLALEAVETTRSADGTVLKEAEEALHRAVQESRVVLTVPGVFGVDYTPDGKRLAATQEDGSAVMYDAETGEELVRFCCHDEPMVNLRLSSDGKLLATTSEDRTARLWDADTGRQLHVLRGFEDRPTSPTFSPDGKLVAATSFDNVVRIWNVASGKLVKALTGREVPFGLAFSSDGRLLATSGLPTTVWNVRTGKQELVFEGLPDAYDVTFSRDRSRIAIATAEGFTNLYDRDGKELLALSGHVGAVNSVEFSPDGESVVTSGEDGTVKIWDADGGDELMSLSGLGGGVQGVVWNPDGTRIAAGSGSGVVKVWDVTPQGAREIWTTPAHEAVAFSVSYHPDGTRLASGSFFGTVGVWDARTGKQLFGLPRHGEHPVEIYYSPDGKLMATNREDHLRIWDAQTGRAVRRIGRHEGAILGHAFSPDGTKIASAGLDATARVWDLETEEELAVMTGHDDLLTGVAWSPDGTKIASVSNDETAKVWDAETGEELATMRRHRDTALNVKFSPDGKRIFTVSFDGTMKIWEVATGDLIRTVTGHSAGVVDVVVSPDGKKVATPSQDKSVKLWDPDTGRELLSIEGGAAVSVAFSPDGSHLVVGQEDGSIRAYALSINELVTVARERLTREFTDQECRQYLHVARCPAS